MTLPCLPNVLVVGVAGCLRLANRLMSRLTLSLVFLSVAGLGELFTLFPVVIVVVVVVVGGYCLSFALTSLFDRFGFAL